MPCQQMNTLEVLDDLIAHNPTSAAAPPPAFRAEEPAMSELITQTPAADTLTSGEPNVSASADHVQADSLTAEEPGVGQRITRFLFAERISLRRTM